MGLLDDVIREHLELKRLRGADLSEVILEEREAFGLVPHREAVSTEQAENADEVRATAGEGHTSGGAATHSDLPSLSQETVELDMRTVLGAESVEGSGYALGASPSGASDAPLRVRTESPASESPVPGGGSPDAFLAWEAPGERRDVLSGQLH
jgi:hypothetical protein